jgi:hypothetical protein
MAHRVFISHKREDKSYKNCEEDFLNDPQKYIENAYDKSQNIDNYDITKQR